MACQTTSLAVKAEPNQEVVPHVENKSIRTPRFLVLQTINYYLISSVREEQNTDSLIPSRFKESRPINLMQLMSRKT